jgi:AcrR family transcriptional regulator
MQSTRRSPPRATAASKRAVASRPHPRAAVRASAQAVYRDAILSAAERVFARRGFVTAKMIDIAREAGISVGTLYNYFDNKEALVGSLFTVRGDQLVHRMEEVAAASSNPVARVGALIETCMRFIEEYRDVIQMIFQLGGELQLGARHISSEAADDNQQRVMAIFERAVRDAAAAGALRKEIAVADLVSFISGGMHGFVEAWLRRGSKPGLTRKAPLVLDLILRGVGTDP